MKIASCLNLLTYSSTGEGVIEYENIVMIKSKLANSINHEQKGQYYSQQHKVSIFEATIPWHFQVFAEVAFKGV